MRRMHLMVVLAALCAFRAGAETNLLCEVFDFHYHWIVTNEPSAFSESKVKALLSDYGVVWPRGSQICAVRSGCEDVDKIVVINTEENLERCRNVLEESHEHGGQVEVRLDVFSFSRDDVEKLLNVGSVDCEQLMSLRKQGRAKLVTTAQVVTRSGQEACAKNCTEVIYPTEIRQKNATNQNSSAGSLVPSDFEMREVGTIFQVIPEVSADGKTIHLIVNPEWVTLSGWETFAARTVLGGRGVGADFKQPVFNVSTLQTQLMLHSGETVLLGGGTSVEEGKTILYHFLTAKKVPFKKGAAK